LSHWSWFFAYVLSAMVRGVVVGCGVLLAGAVFVGQSSVLNFSLWPQEPLWVLVFAFSGACMLGALGLIAGLWADKFDQMAAFQNFIIMPMTFLSGVFYSIHSLPGFWQERCVALAEFWRGGYQLVAGVEHRGALAAHGLQDQRVSQV
jgi:ABC-2 type transport system permease protein